jgi:hypothetical protein
MRVFILAMLLLCVPAYAHGPAQWIQDGRYRNAVGDLCCGEHDCKELPDESVKATSQGYQVHLLIPKTQWAVARWINEVVPYSEAQPSPDGKFWRCEWGGTRKCFFAPPPNS